MHMMTRESKSVPMFDIRRKVQNHTDPSGDMCDGVHQRNCSLEELYLLAQTGEPVTLVCWDCGSEAELVEIDYALETAAGALADQLRTLQKVLRQVRVDKQMTVMVQLVENAIERDGQVNARDVNRVLARNAQMQARFTSCMSRIVVLDD